MLEEKKGISKEKSAMYPAFTLNEIITDFIEVIDSLGGKGASVDLVAKTLNVSPSTKSFTRKLSAAKQYGLINLSKGVIELTELSKNILYPTTDNSKKYFLDAFSNPPIYEKLISRYNGRALPNNVMLSNVLMDPEFSITKNVKDLVVEKFVTNCQDLGILKNGILDIESNDDIDHKLGNYAISNHNENDNSEMNNISMNNSDGYQEMAIPIPGKNQHIKVLIPNDFELDDYVFFQKYIEAVLPMYIENIKNKNQA